MNAIELFHSDGKPANVFYCEKCRNVASYKDIAEKCCLPRICECGKECEDKYWTICRGCNEKKEIQKELERFNAAEKVDKFDGWVWADGLSYNEGFADSVHDIIDYCKDNDIEIPDYVWTCKENHFCFIDLNDILQEIEENGYEDFCAADSCKGLDELKLAIDKFNEINRKIESYVPNYKKALIITKEINK